MSQNDIEAPIKQAPKAVQEIVLVVIRVMQPGQRRHMKHAAHMPLHDGFEDSHDDTNTEAR